MTFLQVNDLSVRFPDHSVPVLHGINLRIHSKERILLLGPSGSGKSTLLLALSGLIPRSVEADLSGEVLLSDKPVHSLPPNEVCQKLGFLFQDPESQFCMLYPEDEMAFGLENLGLPSKEMPKRINQAFDQVGLREQHRRTRIDQLSGGQQQRLALASILSQQSDFILLDEPTANLDPHGRRSVVNAAEEIAHSGKGLLVVEHNLDPWFPLLERVLILGPDGRLLDDGTPSVLFSRWGRYLDEIGVWKPKAVQVAEVLSSRGYHCDPLPLNVQALQSLSLPTDVLCEALEELEPPFPKADLASSTPIITLSQVNFQYPTSPQVLHDINLTIKAGEFWALVGPNGSGKSTLARTLIGMVKAKGTIELAGKPLNKIKSRELSQNVGYVFQNPEHQFVTDSVWEELAFSVRQLQLNPTERKERIEAMLKFFDLEHLAASNPFTLSGGQKRRLSVATMLVGGQKILVLDEPTFGQDQRSAHHLMERIFQLNQAGVTILMITHDLDLVDRYASHVAVLKQGHLIFTGAVSNLWVRPDILLDSQLECPFTLQVLGADVKRGSEDARSYQSYRQFTG